MQKRTRPDAGKDEIRTAGIEEACARYGLGRVTMRKVAEDAGAVIRLGRRYLVNIAKVDLYMDAISQSR